jgi:hypothetical protein
MGGRRCGCGCGTVLDNPARRFVSGHDAKLRPAGLVLQARGMDDATLIREVEHLVELLGREPELGWESWRRLGVLAAERSIRLARSGFPP